MSSCPAVSSPPNSYSVFWHSGRRLPCLGFFTERTWSLFWPPPSPLSRPSSARWGSLLYVSPNPQLTLLSTLSLDGNQPAAAGWGGSPFLPPGYRSLLPGEWTSEVLYDLGSVFSHRPLLGQPPIPGGVLRWNACQPSLPNAPRLSATTGLLACWPGFNPSPPCCCYRSPFLGGLPPASWCGVCEPGWLQGSPLPTLPPWP